MYVITQIVEINTQVLLGDYLRLLKYHKYIYKQYYLL